MQGSTNAGQVMHGEPPQEVKPWLSKLAQVEHKRSRFQDMAAEGYITFEELGAKLSDLEEIRTTAVEKLEAIRNYQERTEEMEQDRDALLESYALRAPEALNRLTPEGAITSIECSGCEQPLKLAAL